jgi:hypothetical protein
VARSEKTRIAAARHRATVAKLVLGGAGALAFLVAAGLARVGYPGHHKKAIRPLAPPGRFVHIVRENQLQSGILAPTRADPSVGTGQT